KLLSLNVLSQGLPLEPVQVIATEGERPAARLSHSFPPPRSSELERKRNYDFILGDSLFDNSRVARWRIPDRKGRYGKPRPSLAAVQSHFVAEIPCLCLREADGARLAALVEPELDDHALPLHENLRCRGARVVVEVARRQDSHPGSPAYPHRRKLTLAPPVFAGLRAVAGGALSSLFAVRHGQNASSSASSVPLAIMERVSVQN